jgi:ADP-ribosyl-[dinitrogen reductase] hydrolase
MTASEPGNTRDDRRTGAILGLAVGDALGAAYEFCSPAEVPEGPLEIVGGGWLDLEPGETTDDTALAKAVLEGYQERPLDLRRVRDAMLRWEDSDPPDIGNQTKKALDYLRNHPEALSLPDDPDAQGNGTVMRTAPHGVMAESPEQAVENAWVEAALSHPSWEARASSALVAGIVACLIEGQSPHEALETSWLLVEARDESGKRVREVLRPLERYEHRSSGWTVYTTRLALLALLEAPDFRLGLEKVIRLAGDADTNGAVTGALLGARFGAGEIPTEWLRILWGKEELQELTRSGQ